MLQVGNERIALTMADDGTDVVLEDRVRRARWRLDESTRLVAKAIEPQAVRSYGAAQRGAAGITTLGPGRARRLNERMIESRHAGAAGELVLRWILEKDRLRVVAVAEESSVTALALPGTFRPESSPGFLAAVPSAQGILHTGKGPAFFRPLNSRAHGGFTMAMFGQIAGGAALLSLVEEEADTSLHWEKTEAGAVDLMWLAHPSFDRLGYDRETVLMCCEPGLTQLCKTYRQYEIDHGRFKNWQAKIAERPNLEKLFGAAMVFIGYLQDAELDYAQAYRQLRQAGIDKAYIYPVYMDSTIAMEQVLKEKWLDDRQNAALLRELGYAAGSFLYITDGPMGQGDQPQRDLILDAKGQPLLIWSMEEARWYALSNETRLAWTRKLIDGGHRDLQGVHFDVLMTGHLRQDHNPLHLADNRADRDNRRQMLQYAASQGLIVSSEGFWGRMADTYDLGNSKYPFALGGEEYCVVPMSMLVYHDSAIHSWWEVDNYNNPEHRSQGGRGHHDRYAWGGGHMRQQSLMDALLGTPPDIFPFGRQYNYVPHNHPRLYTYRFRLDDEKVRRAIEYAKPLMKLHQRIGKLEMIGHRLHREDGAVQEVTYADGTRVMVNFANVALEAPGAGLMAAESWRIVE